MSTALGFNLKRFIENESKAHGHAKAVRMAERKVKELLKEGLIKAQDISLKELAISFCGYRWYETLNSMREGTDALKERKLLEADATVDNTAFSNITGQIVYSKIHEGYEDEAFIGDMLVETIPSTLETEKIPGMQDISDSAVRVEEGMPILYAGHGESFQVTPITYKRALGISITKEAVFFDRTNRILRKAQGIGRRVAIVKEKQILDMVVGTDNNYNWRNLALNTYIPGPLTPGLWVNDFVGNELLSWNNVDTAMQQFQDVRNPETGDPILVGGMQVLVPPAKRMTARRILSATEIRETTGATETLSGNPLPPGMTMMSSQLLRDRIALISGVNDIDKYWFIGDFKRAFAWMQNWPLTVVQAPTNNPDEFERDIIAKWKASERGIAAVMDPRFVQRNRLT